MLLMPYLITSFADLNSILQMDLNRITEKSIKKTLNYAFDLTFDVSLLSFANSIEPNCEYELTATYLGNLHHEARELHYLSADFQHYLQAIMPFKQFICAKITEIGTEIIAAFPEEYYEKLLVNDMQALLQLSDVIQYLEKIVKRLKSFLLVKDLFSKAMAIETQKQDIIIKLESISQRLEVPSIAENYVQLIKETETINATDLCEKCIRMIDETIDRFCKNSLWPVDQQISDSTLCAFEKSMKSFLSIKHQQIIALIGLNDLMSTHAHCATLKVSDLIATQINRLAASDSSTLQATATLLQSCFDIYLKSAVVPKDLSSAKNYLRDKKPVSTSSTDFFKTSHSDGKKKGTVLQDTSTRRPNGVTQSPCKFK